VAQINDGLLDVIIDNLYPAEELKEEQQ